MSDLVPSLSCMLVFMLTITSHSTFLRMCVQWGNEKGKEILYWWEKILLKSSRNTHRDLICKQWRVEARTFDLVQGKWQVPANWALFIPHLMSLWAVKLGSLPLVTSSTVNPSEISANCAIHTTTTVMIGIACYWLFTVSLCEHDCVLCQCVSMHVWICNVL